MTVRQDGMQGIDFLRRSMPGLAIRVILLSALINVLGLGLPLVLMQVYDRIIPNASYATLTLLLVGLFGAVALEGLLRYGRSQLTAWAGARSEHVLGWHAFQRLLQSDTQMIQKEGPGEQLRRLNGVTAIRDLLSGRTLVAACDLPFAVLYFAAVGYLGGPLVLVPIVIGFLLVFLAMRLGHRLRGALVEQTFADDRRMNFVLEVLSGVHTVKGLAIENQMLRRYERLQRRSALQQYDIVRASHQSLNLGVLFSQLTVTGTVMVGASEALAGHLTTGGLAACVMLAARAVQPLQRVVGTWLRFQHVQHAKERLTELWNLPPEPGSGGLPLPPVAGRLELQGVTRRCRAEGRILFGDIHLEISPGELVGITGPARCGSVILLRVCAGLMPPDAGRVLVDGRDLAQFDPMSVRRQIVYLPGGVPLFEGTILDNLTMFEPDRARLAKQIAEQLGLHQEIARLPQGYATPVGQAATETLPRGTCELIGICRTLASPARILLFDQTDSALDRRADARFREVLGSLRGKRTVLLSTRRPSSLAIADRAFYLDKGRLSPYRFADPSVVAGAGK